LNIAAIEIKTEQSRSLTFTLEFPLSSFNEAGFVMGKPHNCKRPQSALR